MPLSSVTYKQTPHNSLYAHQFLLLLKRIQMWKLHYSGGWDHSVDSWHICTFEYEKQHKEEKANIRVAFSLTHAGNDAMHWQAGQTMVYGLVHAPGIPPCDSPWWLLLASDKSWILFFGDVYIKAYVRCPHDVAGTRVEQDVGGVEPAHSNQTHAVPAITETRWGLAQWLWTLSHLGFYHDSILFVSVKRGKRKTFALVFPKEFTLLQADVMHFIRRAAPVGAVPLVCWTHTSLPATNQEISLRIEGKTQII